MSSFFIVPLASVRFSSCMFLFFVALLLLQFYFAFCLAFLHLLCIFAPFTLNFLCLRICFSCDFIYVWLLLCFALYLLCLCFVFFALTSLCFADAFFIFDFALYLFCIWSMPRYVCFSYYRQLCLYLSCSAFVFVFLSFSDTNPQEFNI